MNKALQLEQRLPQEEATKQEAEIIPFPEFIEYNNIRYKTIDTHTLKMISEEYDINLILGICTKDNTFYTYKIQNGELIPQSFKEISKRKKDEIYKQMKQLETSWKAHLMVHTKNYFDRNQKIYPRILVPTEFKT